MKKVIMAAAALSLVGSVGFSSAALAGGKAPSVAEINKDIANYQAFFKKRFPTVPLEAYADGVNAIPQYAERRANWELLMEFPPYEPYVDKARKLWKKPFNNGKTFDDCFRGKPAANHYPYWGKDNKIHTLEADINSCLKANGETPLKNLKHKKIALLTLAYREKFNGKKIKLDFRAEGMRKVYATGRHQYWAKRGQLNFSCASCHVIASGQKVRGDVLSPGLGHTSGFPVFRTKWSLKGKPFGTPHRRYGGCNKQVRAKPFKPQSPQYIGLEVYETAMNTGIPLKVPSQRQ